MNGSDAEAEAKKIEKKLREKQPRERARTSHAGREERETAGWERVRTAFKTCKEGGVVFAACTVLTHIEYSRGRERALLYSNQVSSENGGVR